MAVRAFDGVNATLDTATGALATNAFGTFAIIVKRGTTGAWHTFLALHQTDTAPRNQFAYEAANLSALWDGVATDTGPAAIGTADWGLVLVRKATGVTTPRFSLYNFTSGTWVHGNASGTSADWATPTATGSVRFQWKTGDRLNGRVAVRGAWNTLRWSLDAAGDAAIEAAGLHTSLQKWLDAAPSALWRFDQAATTTAVTDLTGGGADQTVINGTTVVAGDDPPGFNFTLGTGLSVPVVQSVEVNTANAVTPSKRRDLGQAAETDVANTITPAKSLAIGQALQTETAGVITPSKSLPIGQAVEINTAQPISVTGSQQIAIGQALETDTSGVIAPAKSLTIDLATTVETAGSITPRKSLAIGAALEVDTANPVIASGGVVILWPPKAGTPSLRGVSAGAPRHDLITAGSPKQPP